MGAGDVNGTRPRAHEVTNPCNESPGNGLDDSLGPLPKRPQHVPAPPQVSDPTNYAIAGKVLLAVAGAFAGVLVALVALHLYNTTRRRRGLDGGGQRRLLLRSLAIAGGVGDEDRRDGDGDGAGAPFPRGLDSAVLAAIPVVLIDAGAGAGNGGDCAVCLAELEPGEKARALPRCGHRFHVECIDVWFRGNATCPLCRADVVVVAPGAAAPSAPPEGGAQPEVRIDVSGDAVAAAPANGSTVAPVMGRLHSGRDLEKARRVFASTRFSSF